eukprot:gb/GECG01008062.1/.p1 GENE.gb/GECG01008062.1/~~gb/GECG01008062.1/.p1  ORF type:complete len:429 (+),score=66.39 gb/GECG01008062.1/:1-1287(+)
MFFVFLRIGVISLFDVFMSLYEMTNRTDTFLQAAARPLVNVYDGTTGKKSHTLPLPSVLTAPIRRDVVHFVHSNMAKNSRQAYGQAREAGHQHSAESWGTGRAVARIPRISGSGTHANGQGAFGNMCRGGRIFAPIKSYRKWHRKINVNQRRYATASALAASAVPPLVMARGHKIDNLEEVPLVVSGIEGIKKTKEATAVLERLGAFEDVQKVKDTKRIRVGKGKARNRRHVLRKGPLVIFNENNGIEQAFRNIPGVELCSVDRMNLLQLAPGGHMGRLIVWTDGAFQRLEGLFGSLSKKSEEKHNYQPPRPLMNNADLARIINSEEVQKKLRPTVKQNKRPTHKKNPLKNLGAMVKLNPYAMTRKRNELLAQEARKEGRAQKVQKKRAMSKEKQKAIKQSGLEFYNSLKNDTYTFGRHGDARAPQEE